MQENRIPFNLALAALCCLLHAAPALALPVQPTARCTLQSCGYTIDPSIRCASLPANYALQVEVTCGAQGLGNELPELVLEDGTVLASTWQRVEIDPEGDSERYVRTGPELPVGQVVRVMHRVPQACYAARVSELCEEGLACLEASPKSCCRLFDEAGLTFAAFGEIVDGVVQRREPELAGSEVPLAPLNDEYTRFFVVEADRTPPPAVSLRVDCRHQGSENSGIYGVDFRLDGGDLSDVSRLDLMAFDTAYATLEKLGEWRAVRCSGQPARQFDIDPIEFSGISHYQLMVVSHDDAGNSTNGPRVSFSFPEQCSGVTLTAPSNGFASLCSETAYGVDESAAYCEPAEASAGDAAAGEPYESDGAGGAGAESDEASVLGDLATCDAALFECAFVDISMAPEPEPSVVNEAASPSASTSDPIAPEAPPKPARAESCQCATPGVPQGSPGAWLISIFLALACRRRRNTGEVRC